jgi:hypothetical protein
MYEIVQEKKEQVVKMFYHVIEVLNQALLPRLFIMISY